jgi:hypothetical protein
MAEQNDFVNGALAVLTSRDVVVDPLPHHLYIVGASRVDNTWDQSIIGNHSDHALPCKEVSDVCVTLESVRRRPRDCDVPESWNYFLAPLFVARDETATMDIEHHRLLQVSARRNVHIKPVAVVWSILLIMDDCNVLGWLAIERLVSCPPNLCKDFSH